jgi:arylsulfatase A-like enzyme
MRILFLDIDTLRPDHLGCYGYHRDTSPHIDRIAAEGVRFTNYFCSDAPCLPSRTGLMTGRFGIHSGVVGHGGTAAEVLHEGPGREFKSRLERESLPGFLNTHGFHTVSISPFAERHGSWSFYAGFNEIYNTGLSGLETADDITPVALDWIRRRAQEDNWFLHINYWDPHTPYRAPVDFGNPFEDDPIPAWITDEILKEQCTLVGPHKPGNLNGFSNKPDLLSEALPEGTIKTPPELTNMKDLKQLFDGYDCGIRYADTHCGLLFDELEKQGVMDDLIIIISSDHAENMGELGAYAEHGTADYATTRIPMIIRWPGCSAGSVIDGLHYNLDLAPTLADMLGADPAPIWDGRSYAPAIREGKECGRDYLVLSQCAHVCQRSVRFDKWFYIRTYHDGFNLFPDEMLFDIENDPHEQENLAEANPDVCREANHLLNEWHDEMMKTMDSATDPLWTVIREGGPLHARGQLREYCEFLENTERSYAIEPLRSKHPQEFGAVVNPLDYSNEATMESYRKKLTKKFLRD